MGDHGSGEKKRQTCHNGATDQNEQELLDSKTTGVLLDRVSQKMHGAPVHDTRPTPMQQVNHERYRGCREAKEEQFVEEGHDLLLRLLKYPASASSYGWSVTIRTTSIPWRRQTVVDRGAKSPKSLEICRSQLRRVHENGFFVAFETLEPSPVRKLEVDLGPVEDLHENDFVVRTVQATQRVDNLLGLVESIGDKDQKTPPRQTGRHVANHAGHRSVSASLNLAKLRKESLELPATGSWRNVFAHAIVKDHEPDLVLLSREQICESCRNSDGVVQFADAVRGEIHGTTRVHEDRGAEVGLLLELSDVVPIGPAEYLPVKVTKIVPSHVRTMLKKIRAETVERRSMQTGNRPLDHLASHDLEVRDPCECPGIEKRLRV